MTRVPVGISVLFHGTVCMPYSGLLSKDMPSPREMLQLPPPGSHPVLIARKLLLLGSFLQGIPSKAFKDLGGSGARCREVMSQVVETASRLVTSNDDLVGSLEGIECIMIESMYQNNTGNLRHAWLTNRRALVMAQTMGLHLGSSSSPRMFDVETQKRIDPQCMWARLVISDRYLSLMLGLPQGSQESSFATPKALAGCAPVERMERILAVAGGLILQRNRNDLHNLETTHEIDKLLQNAAASMPARWWLTPDIASVAGLDANAFGETIRLMNQFAHYHLLAQLHLPYVLLSSADRKYDYSKITAVNASREILSRFVCFRGSDAIAAYCRGIDFLAFIASTTLCLAHIDARRKYGSSTSDGATIFHFLAHQRLGDRGLMECTLQSMENMVKADNDTIACRIASILRRLLAIEAAVANGVSYHAGVSFEDGEQSSLPGGGMDSDTLCIDIPCFGTIKVAATPGENAGLHSASKASHSGRGFYFQSSSPVNRTRRQSRQDETPFATCPTEYQIGGQSVDANGQAVPSHLGSLKPTEESQATASDNGFFSLEEISLGAGYLLEPEVDDWALHGVDIALFESLSRSEDPAIT